MKIGFREWIALIERHRCLGRDIVVDRNVPPAGPGIRHRGRRQLVRAGLFDPIGLLLTRGRQRAHRNRIRHTRLVVQSL